MKGGSTVKLLKRLFVVPADEKVTERCMTRMLICSVCSILLCVVCLASTTWAWYTTQETYEGSVIRGAQWDVPETTEASEPTTGETQNTTGSEETQSGETHPEETQGQETYSDDSLVDGF